MKTILNIASLFVIPIAFASCSSLTVSQKAQIQAVAIGAAKGAAISAGTQAASGQKINTDAVAQAALTGAAAALAAPTSP